MNAEEYAQHQREMAEIAQRNTAARQERETAEAARAAALQERLLAALDAKQQQIGGSA